MEKNIVATVDGVGVVEAKNDRANFSLTLRAKADNLAEAIKELEVKTDNTLKKLESLKMSLDGNIETATANYKLENREGSERYEAGYQSVNTLTWSVVVDDHINEIYKTCLKFDSNTPKPSFHLKDREVLEDQALQKASDNVKAKLEKECNLLGIDSNDLKILNWSFGYDGNVPTNKNMGQSPYYGNVTGVTGPQGSADNRAVSWPNHNPVMKLGSIYQELLDAKLVPGTVQVRMAVIVNYIWKD